MSGKTYKKLRKEMRRDIREQFKDFTDYIREENFWTRLRIAWRILWKLT